jgi:polysaccharide export outer membrane protein
MTRFRQTSRWLALSWLLTSVGISLALQQIPPAQEKRKDADTSSEKQPVADNRPPVDGLPASVDPNTYKIGSEDVIRIHVWKEPDLSFVAGVRPDGKVTAPLLGDITANGYTPTAFGALLKEKLGELVNNPLVNVEVLQVRSKKYYITGPGAARSGLFPLVVPTTVLEALTMAGGLAEWANKKKIIIMRGDQRLKFNYDAAIKGKGKKEDNILLENGDFIVVN